MNLFPDVSHRCVRPNSIRFSARGNSQNTLVPEGFGRKQEAQREEYERERRPRQTRYVRRPFYRAKHVIDMHTDYEQVNSK